MDIDGEFFQMSGKMGKDLLDKLQITSIKTPSDYAKFSREIGKIGSLKKINIS